MRITLIVFVLALAVRPCWPQVVVFSPEDALSLAMTYSHDQRLQQMAAQEGMRHAKLSLGNFLPQLGFTYSESDNVKRGMADSRNKSLQLSVNQPIFDGGAAWNQYQVERLSSQYRYEEAVQVLEEFKGTVLDSYQQLLMQQEVVEIKRRLRESGEVRLAVMETELALGLVREIDYLDYVISCRRLEQEERLAGEELERQQTAFRRLLGLPHGTEIEVRGTSRSNPTERRFLAPLLGQLLPRCLSHSPSLKRVRLEYEASRMQEKLSRAWFLPTVSLEGSLSLSGTEFPLREPDYSLRIKVSFDKNRLLPLNTTTSMGFDQNRLTSLGNSVSATVNPDTAYFSELRLNSISLMRQQLALAATEEDLREGLRELMLRYDTDLENLGFLEQSLEIQRKKAAINLRQLENGEMTEMDYLQSLIELSTMEIQLVELNHGLETLLRTVELTAGIPPGGIDEIIFP